MVNRASWERYLGPAGLALIAIGLIAAVIGAGVLVFDSGGDGGEYHPDRLPQQVFTTPELLTQVEGQLRNEYRQANPAAVVTDDVYKGNCRVSDGASDPWTIDSSVLVSCDVLANQGGTPVKTGGLAVFQVFATGLTTRIV